MNLYRTGSTTRAGADFEAALVDAADLLTTGTVELSVGGFFASGRGPGGAAAFGGARTGGAASVGNSSPN